MWNEGLQLTRIERDALQAVKAEEGYLTDEVAKAYLGELFAQELGFLWHLLSGNEIAEWQEIVLKAWFRKDRSLLVATRAAGKSYLMGIFCLLYAIIHKNSTIVMVAANFRQIKTIFQKIEGFMKHPKAGLLRSCFTKNGLAKHAPDLYEIECINGSVIKGLPMSGENLRGQRATVLCIDEGLMLSEAIYDTVLKPFLNARLNANEELEIRTREDELIALGQMTEEDRTVFPSNKVIITSSASYKFEYLYTGLWQPYVSAILDPARERKQDSPTYFAMRLSFRALEKVFYMDHAQYKALEEEGKSETDTSKRENEALFTDASDTYFNVKKLRECTVPDGETPTVEIKGSKECQYILAIDPAYGDNKNNDFFAMGVYMLVPDERRIIQVNTYGRAGSDLKNHYEYLAYVLRYFNIVWIAIDASGTEFIDGFNESDICKSLSLRLGYLDANLDSDEYMKEVEKAKMSWNVTTRNIVYPQKFQSSVIRSMNEYLQGGIAAKRVWFGSKLMVHPTRYPAALEVSLPFQPTDDKGNIIDRSEFIGEQDDWIMQTQRQLGMICVKNTVLGALQYDLPTHLKKSGSPTRPRKDNYTTLMIAYYSSKHLFEIMYAPEVGPEVLPVRLF